MFHLQSFKITVKSKHFFSLSKNPHYTMCVTTYFYILCLKYLCCMFIPCESWCTLNRTQVLYNMEKHKHLMWEGEGSIIRELGEGGGGDIDSFILHLIEIIIIIIIITTLNIADGQ